MINHQLVELYNRASKHSNYQILAKPLRKYVPDHLLTTKSRYEQERLEYILKKLDILNVTIAEIGGNTGFFTFELIDRGASSSIFIEGNPDQTLFVQEAAQLLGHQNRIDLHQKYLTFKDDLEMIDVDICLLLNVLHHVGDDYNAEIQTIESAHKHILFSLNQLSGRCKTLVFQLGFNWQGNINLPLFVGGEKREMIEFIAAGTADFWKVLDIGIAVPSDQGIVYEDLNADNVQRIDELGEFLNRPVFILGSKTV